MKTQETKTNKKSEAVAIIFKNYQLKLLGEILNVPLQSKDARARNAFVKLLGEKLQKMEEDRLTLIKDYAQKDKDGKLKTDGKNFVIIPEKVAEFNKEMEKLLKEDVIVDLIPSTKALIPSIKKIVENTNIRLNIVDTNIYDEVCKALGI